MIEFFRMQTLLAAYFFYAVVAAQKLTQCPTTAEAQLAASGKVYKICPGTDLQIPSTYIQSGVTSSQDCLQLCDSSAGCALAVFNKIYNVCYLKGSGSMTAWAADTAYDTIYATTKIPDNTILQQCPYQEQSQSTSKGSGYLICPGSDYRGNTSRAVHSVANAFACVTACSSDATCSKAVYDATNFICHLKDSSSTLTWVSSSGYSTIRLNSSSTPQVAKTPMMGYNSYNHVGCSPNNDVMNASMTALAKNGFIDLGYKYFQVDCGWQGYDRLSNGSITYDANAFPRGIKPLSDRARSLGFKWSMYTDQGKYSCDTQFARMRPGSLGYETIDAAMFATWNTEYVKVDNCFVDANNNAPKDPRTDFPTRFSAMRNALLLFNIPNMLVCQWGVPYLNTTTNTLQGPYNWAPSMSTSFRLTDDISYGQVSWMSILRIYNQAIHLNLNGRPTSSIPDLDLLEVGNPGLTVDEQKTHFAIWATFKSALMISTDPTKMSPDTMSILGNKGLIAINQDPLGAPVKLVQRYTNDYDIFCGPLSNGDQVVFIVSLTNSQRTLSFALSSIGLVSADVTDVWTGKLLGTLTTVSQTVAGHGSMVLRLSRIATAAPASVKYTYIEAESGTRVGAWISSCPACSGGSKVGGLMQGTGNTLNIPNIYTSRDTINVFFDYINADVQYLGSSTGSNRAASISVNGAAGTTVLFPFSGYDWSGSDSVLKNFAVRLSGFKTDGPNTIAISAIAGLTDAPDFDRIGVPQ